MSTQGSACTASSDTSDTRIWLNSDAAIPKSTYRIVMNEVLNLTHHLFADAGMMDAFPMTLWPSCSVWDSVKPLNKSKVAKISKTHLAIFAEKTCELMIEMVYPALRHMSSDVEECEKRLMQCQEELIASQRLLVETQDRLVKLQCQLLEKRETEISEVQTTAQEEIRSFSDVLQKSCDTALAPQRVRRAIAVATEDRSSNIIVHGMSDSPSEDSGALKVSVGNLIRKLGQDEGNVVSMERLGVFKEGSVRPVKLCLKGKLARDKVLQCKRSLRESDRYKDVFVSADLTQEERVERRRLVCELKERRAADPGKTFFIKGGKIKMGDT